MTITELMEIVAEMTGAEPDVVHGFFQSFVDVMVERLDAGDEVKIRGLGTFRWGDVPESKIPIGADYGPHGDDFGNTRYLVAPTGRKLKFFPAKQFRSRRTEMSDKDEGMTKLGVELDDDKTKTADQRQVDACPVCLSELDDAGACPKHGTEPFEPSGQ
jgi:hypothetical protein